MKVTHRREGDIIFGMAEIPLQHGIFNQQDSEVTFYFEMDSNFILPIKYEDGQLIVGCNISAEFEYKKEKGFKISTRHYENVAQYASAIEGAIKDFEHYVKISSTF